MVLLAAIEQFEHQTTTKVLIAALEEYEDSGTTQKEDVKKTLAKCYHQLCIFVVNARIVKVENKNISGQYSKSYNPPRYKVLDG